MSSEGSPKIIDRRYLCLTKEGDVRRVLLLEESRDAPINTEYRISPIFPTDSLEAPLPDFSGECYIGFFWCPNAFTAIAHLRARFGNAHATNGSKLSSHIWYSHGLASLIILASDVSIIDRAVVELGSRAAGYEIWGVNSHCIEPRAQVEPDPTFNPSIHLTDYSKLSTELVNELDEFRCCLSTAFNRCSRYGSDLKPVLDSVLEIGNDIIAALNSIELAQSKLGRVTKRKLDQANRLHQAHNRLRSEIVQLNAAMSYTISQWFSGLVPLKNFECQIRNHSFLGVGNAYRGILSILYFVEHHFSKASLDSVIASGAYGQATGYDLFCQAPRFEKWRPFEIDKSLDVHLNALRHLLVCYSGRRGFRESPHSITVPLEVLFCGCNPAWSLMTFSHEIMHAHVRGLLSAIFGPVESLPDTAREGQIPAFMTPADFTALAKLHIQHWEDSSRTADRRTCLKLSIIHYCFLFYSEGRHAGVALEGTERAVREPTVDALYSVFDQQHRMINEILVHVLDFQYFYDGEDDLYISLLWISWAIVPGVLDKIYEYILRTLCAISSNIVDEPFENRFNESVSIVRNRLGELCKSHPSPAMLAAHRFITNNDDVEALRIEFYASSYLVDVARHLLFSRATRENLMLDENLEKDGNYRLDTGQFSSIRLGNPVVFLRSMLQRCLSLSLSGEAQSRITAWTLLVAASTNHDKEL